MWKKIAEYGQLIFGLIQDVAKLKRDVATMRIELDELSLTVRDLVTEMRHRNDLWERDQKILVLELQHRLDQFERRLPPAS